MIFSSTRSLAAFQSHDVLRGVLLVALHGAAEQWRWLQPPNRQSWKQFVAAFREEFLPVVYKYRIRHELDTETQHSKEALLDYVRAMQKLFRRADPTAPEAIKVSHVMH